MRFSKGIFVGVFVGRCELVCVEDFVGYSVKGGEVFVFYFLEEVNGVGKVGEFFGFFLLISKGFRFLGVFVVVLRRVIVVSFYKILN